MFSNPKNLRIVKDLFINGKFVKAQKGQTFDVINPANEEVIASIQRGSNQDIDIAVKAAREAFDNGPWRRMDPQQRAQKIFKLSDLIVRNLQELASLQSYNNGKPFSVSKMADVPFSSLVYRHYAGWVDKIRGHTLNMDGPFTAYTRKEPVGVIAHIIPWNFPLVLLANKLAPSLAAGCTSVVKTAQLTPLSALRLAEFISQAGIPPGVVNIVSGFGDIGSHLAKHPSIDKISFTGSTKVGYDLIRNSHVKNIKRVTFQLGGKSANIITKNADLQSSLHQASFAAFINAGQCCIAGTRTYVHQSLYEKYLEKIVNVAKTVKVGDPFNEQTTQGPLISQKQFQKVQKYIEKGKEEGAKIIFGGKRVGTKGFFIQPTIFRDVKEEMTIAKEQIFGPVMSVFKFSSNEQVIKRANDSQYGLGAGVMSQDPQELQYFIERFKAGTVFGNCYNVFGVNTPFGGYKDSGLGREMGQEGLNCYLETKTVIMKK